MGPSLSHLDIFSFPEPPADKMFFLSFVFLHLPSSNLGLTHPGTYNPNARGSDACKGSNCLWTGTLDRYTRAGLPECVVSTMSGPLPETAQERSQIKDTHTPNPRTEIKIPDPAGNRTQAAGLEGRDYRPRQWRRDRQNIHGGKFQTLT